MEEKEPGYHRARVLEVTAPINRGRNGEYLKLRPGHFIVELKPKGVYRHTNDVENCMFTLTNGQMKTLKDTKDRDWSIFEDTTR